MNYLYTKSGLEELEQAKKKNLTFMVLSIVFAMISLVIFLFVATYKTRLLFSILSSVITLLFVLIFIYFISKFLYLKRLCFEYSYLLESKDQVIKCEVLKCSDFLTTLPDKSRCYEVMVKKDDKELIYYLSEIFDINDIKEGKCSLVIYNDYLKGYKYED